MCYCLLYTSDFLRDYNEEVSFNTALLEIEDILNVHNLLCQELGLPVPTYSQRTDEANAIDPIKSFCFVSIMKLQILNSVI